MGNTEHGQGITRRAALARGFTLAAGLALSTGLHSARAQSTPAATPSGNTYARPETLIDAASLMDPAAERALPLALIPADEFAAGHIPGSRQLDWPQLEITDTSDASVARWQTAMMRLLGSLGVTPGRRVVTYDNGTLFAARPWWLLHYLGYDAVHVLDGGLPAWQIAGGDIETDAATPASTPAAMSTATPAATPLASPVATAGTPRPRPDALATLAEVAASVEDPAVVFVDARTPEEYAAGHIPGAVNVNYPRNAAPHPPHVWLPQPDLEALYAEVGAMPDKRVIPYCTTGVRSAVTFFTLNLIGYDTISLFTGSWAEWSRHPELPVTTGSAP